MRKLDALVCSFKSLYESLQGNYEYNYNEFDYQRMGNNVAVEGEGSTKYLPQRGEGGRVLRTHNSG